MQEKRERTLIQKIFVPHEKKPATAGFLRLLRAANNC